MSLRPPSFRIILALVGASLILWGAKGEVLKLPGLGTFSFFQMDVTVAWTLVASAVAVVFLSSLRTPAIAWLAWAVAVGAVAWFANDILSQVNLMKSNEMLAPIAEAALRTREFKPGAVAIGAGLIIQAVGLCLRRKA